MNVPQLAPQAAPFEVEQWLGELVFSIGLGFHPDTPAGEYVRVDSAEPLIAPSDAKRLDDDLNRAFTLLGDDVYDQGFRFAWRLLHGLPQNTVQDERFMLIQEVSRIDRNGEFTDEDAFRNGWPPMTLEQLRMTLSRLTAESSGEHGSAHP